MSGITPGLAKIELQLPDGIPEWADLGYPVTLADPSAVAELVELLTEAAETAERDASRLYGPKREQLLAQARKYRAALARTEQQPEPTPEHG